jgi:hypothetical protein
MAGIEFDRHSFVRTGQPNRGSTLPVIGLLIVALAIGGAGYISYRLIVAAPSAPTHAEDVQVLDQMRQQIATFDERIEQLEKYRKSVAREARAVPQKREISDPVRPTGPGYQGNARSALASQSTPRDSFGSVSHNPAFAAETAANREAWQATTNRLADVVGVVGLQQDELSGTREVVNRILAKTVRNALPFELRRGAVREPVGPLSLVLKHADVRYQRYTVCVYIDDRCLELKNRSVNEVVSFVLSDNSVPVEFVATKVLHDQIVGYLAVASPDHR